MGVASDLPNSMSSAGTVTIEQSCTEAGDPALLQGIQLHAAAIPV